MDKLKVWLFKLGEPLPIDGVERMHRYGILSSMLAESGHEVVYWTSTFDHFKKKQRSDCNKNIRVDENYFINMVYASGYKNNYSLARIIHHRRMAKNLSNQLRNCEPPDVILSSFPTGEITLALIKYGKMKNVSVVVDIRDLWPDIFIHFIPDYFKCIIKKIVEPLFHTKKIMKNANSIIAISEQYLEWGISLAERKKSNLDKVFYMGYPQVEINTKELKEAELFWDNLDVRVDQFVCCFVGSINRHYNFNTLIAAMKILQKKYLDIKFVICGTGSHFERLEKISGGLTNIILPGWINQVQIVTLMERSKVGLCPYSKKNIISLPNKPFEYFSGGLPILSTLQGELEQINIKHKVGITYKAENVQSFLKAFFQIYNNKSERKIMENNARKIYENYFSSEKVYSKLIKYLEEIRTIQ